MSTSNIPPPVASPSSSFLQTIFSFIFGIIHSWICIPIICKQFNGLIGKSKERLVINFPLVNQRCFFGGLKDSKISNNNKNVVELIVHRPIMFCWRMWLDRKMGLGEGFMEGDWDCVPSSKALLTLLIRARKDNSTVTRVPPKPKTFFSRCILFFGDSIRSIVATLNYFQHKWRTNTLVQSQKNIRSLNLLKYTGRETAGADSADNSDEDEDANDEDWIMDSEEYNEDENQRDFSIDPEGEMTADRREFTVEDVAAAVKWAHNYTAHIEEDLHNCLKPLLKHKIIISIQLYGLGSIDQNEDVSPNGAIARVCGPTQLAVAMRLRRAFEQKFPGIIMSSQEPMHTAVEEDYLIAQNIYFFNTEDFDMRRFTEFRIQGSVVNTRLLVIMLRPFPNMLPEFIEEHCEWEVLSKVIFISSNPFTIATQNEKFQNFVNLCTIIKLEFNKNTLDDQCFGGSCIFYISETNAKAFIESNPS